MPVHRAAYKSIRSDKKKRLVNARVSTELKTLHKKLSGLIGAKKLSEARETLKVFTSRLGKAASKGIISKNTASRRVSRLTKQINKLERG